MKRNRHFSLPENPLNFIKIIVSDDPRSTGIMIPVKFTKKHGQDLLDRVMVKIPNGDVWQIGLKKSRGKIWLKNGWREFAQHYGLNFGHLLVFKYEGFSIFGVIIFNVSSIEIVYPRKNNDDQLRNPTKGAATKNPQKLKFTSVKSEEETCSSDGEERSTKLTKSEGGRTTKRRKKEKPTLEKAKANFKSHRPFFMIYMQQSYVTRKTGWAVPFTFRKKFLKDSNKHSRYLLELANDETKKTWELAMLNGYCRVAEWTLFVKDNDITIGDTCVFELVNKDRNVLCVTIVRSSP